MNKKYLLYFSLVLFASTAVSAVVFSSAAHKHEIAQLATATTCSGHVGYHYLRKEPTETESGHKEFWACCKCHQQFLAQPEGSFETVDDGYMTGGLDSNHIAYLPRTGSDIPVDSDGGEDSWGDIDWF